MCWLLTCWPGGDDDSLVEVMCIIRFFDYVVELV